jgi:hypothetical protein
MMRAQFAPLASLISCVLLLMGCAAAPAPASAPGPAAIGVPDAANCSAAGGKIRNVCRRQVPACVVPFPDAGQRCTDNSQCKGKCIVDSDHVPAPNENVVGRCQQDDDPCGCKIEVVNGKIGGGACVD